MDATLLDQSMQGSWSTCIRTSTAFVAISVASLSSLLSSGVDVSYYYGKGIKMNEPFKTAMLALIKALHAATTSS